MINSTNPEFLGTTIRSIYFAAAKVAIYFLVYNTVT